MSDLEMQIKLEACETANKLLTVAQDIMPEGHSDEKTQVFLLAMSITLGKFIHAVAASEEARGEIFEGVVDNIEQMFEILDRGREPKQ